MASFQENREQTEQRMLVQLLSEIERNPACTQRGLASELGIALGLMNHYLRRCITKGWVRVSHVSPRRITYFLTPEGFREKSQMVTGYLSRSLEFFRDARQQCEALFAQSQALGWKHLALIGAGDLADIAKLVAQGTGVQVSVVESAAADLSIYDAVIITNITDPQHTYDQVVARFDREHVLTPGILHISRAGHSEGDA